MFKTLIKELESVDRFRWYSFIYMIIAFLSFYKEKESFWILIIGSTILEGISVIINNQNKTNK